MIVWELKWIYKVDKLLRLIRSLVSSNQKVMIHLIMFYVFYILQFIMLEVFIYGS